MALNLGDNRLSLGNARINPLNQHRLMESLNKNTTLKQILLFGSTLTDEVVDDLCALIEHNSTLEQLQFMEEEFTDDGVSKLLSALCTNTSLKQLELRSCKVTDAVVDDLCLLSVQNSTLITLQFHHAEFSDTGLSQLLRSLCSNTHLEHLVFWESRLTDRVVRDLCMCIDTNKVMVDLKFEKATFTDSGLSQLLQSMCDNATLMRICFVWSPLSDAIIGDFCHFIEENHVMRSLRFEAAKFTDPGLGTLLRALSKNLAMENLSLRDSQLSDAVVLPLCRFLNKNNVMSTLVFGQARFTDPGVTAIVQSLMQNHALKELVFCHSHLTDEVVSDVCQYIKQNQVMKELRFEEDRFTDHGVAALLHSLTLNSTLESFQFGRSDLSDTVVSDLCKFVEDNKVMEDIAIIQSAGEGFIKPLMRFLELRDYIVRVKSMDRGRTECLTTYQSNDESTPSCYHIMTVRDKVEILPRSEYLQAELMELLKEHSIPSAVDILNNLLVLFVQKDKEASFKEALSERLKDVHEDIATAHRIHTLHKAPEFVLENDTEQWKSGLWVHAPEIGLTSTVGAILVDDDGKLYLTSTFHGNKFEKCQILNKYEGQCVAEVFSMSPLLDACLIEVQDLEGNSKLSPTLPAPHVDAALCGPYTGPNEYLARNRKPARGQPRAAPTSTVVNKYGLTTYLTEGTLFYYNYTYPDPEVEISDALLVLPSSSTAFTEEGDSGAVIFRHSCCQDPPHTDAVMCHEAIALHSSGVMFDSLKWSAACRLDAVIEHFEAELGKKLKLVGTRTNTLEEFLFRIKLGLVLTEEEPLE